MLTNIHSLLYKHHLLWEHISDCIDLPYKSGMLAILVRNLSSESLRNKTSYCNCLKPTLAIHPFFLVSESMKTCPEKKNPRQASSLIKLHTIFVSNGWFLASLGNWTDQKDIFFACWHQSFSVNSIGYSDKSPLDKNKL